MRRTFVIVFICCFIRHDFGYKTHKTQRCENATWNKNGQTVIEWKRHEMNPKNFYIDRNNHLYLIDESKKKVFVWTTYDSKPTKSIDVHPRDFKYLHIHGNQTMMFRECQEDIQTKNSIAMFDDDGKKIALFVKTNDRQFCISKEFDKKDKFKGSFPENLLPPDGILLEKNFDVYLIHSDQPNFLQSYLFIAEDLDKNKVIKNQHGESFYVDKDEYISKCFQKKCEYFADDNQKAKFTCIRFDIYGNLFVLDEKNHRINKFELENNACYFYPQVGLCKNATWKKNATTWVDQRTLIQSLSRTVFIDVHDHVYTADYNSGKILVWNRWHELIRVLHVPNLFEYTDIFVGLNGDIFFQRNAGSAQIDKWSSFSNQSVSIGTLNAGCFGLFIDSKNHLYCASYSQNTVRISSIQKGKLHTLIGEIRNGQVHQPWGIFVDRKSNIYIAGGFSNRIQKFASDNFSSEVIGVQQTPGNFSLDFPTDIIVGENEIVYVTDTRRHRVLRVAKDFWDCIAGCSCEREERSDTFRDPLAIQFDSNRNLYVADEFNSRIQKFELLTNHCENQPIMTNTSVCHSTAHQHQDGYLTTSCSPINNKTNCTQSTTHCNKFTDFCSIIQPCLNGGTCVDNDQHPLWFFCVCPPLVFGDRCQYDQRACEPNPCHHDGTCTPTSSTSDQSKSDFMCACPEHWEGRRCETKVNYCVNVTCQNGGQCRPLVGGAVCECLKGSYSGRFCEIAARRVVVLRIASKSIGYVAVIALCSVALFVIVMDVLKYGFGIDPTREELEAIRREKREKKRRPVVEKFIYVNRPEDLLPLKNYDETHV